MLPSARSGTSPLPAGTLAHEVEGEAAPTCTTRSPSRHQETQDRSLEPVAVRRLTFPDDETGPSIIPQLSERVSITDLVPTQLRKPIGPVLLR